MPDIPESLREIAEQLRGGESPRPQTVRTLLSWFDQQRRGVHVNSRIRDALNELDLRTEPDFEAAYIDGPLVFRLRPEVNNENDIGQDDAGSIDEVGDPTYRIGRLEAANAAPVCVNPNDRLRTAVTLMLQHDFSQLPVMEGERTVRGMVSWESIGSRLAVEQRPETVRDCLEEAAEVSADASLFATIPTIVEHEYVLVRGGDNRVVGIVTTSDLSLQFRLLAEPFLLLGEIEAHIRHVIHNHFTVEEMRAATDLVEGERVVTSVFELNFGEYLRLLENRDRWDALNLPLDRREFVRQLDRIREIRNDVMHFDPDGLGDHDLEFLRSSAEFLQRLRQLGVT